jgi:hypothetical protein
MGWRSGSSGRVPAEQAQTPDLQKKKKISKHTNKQDNIIYNEKNQDINIDIKTMFHIFKKVKGKTEHVK